MSVGDGRIGLESARDAGGGSPATSNVLFLAPSLHEASTRACFDLVSGDAPADTHVIAVNYTKSPSTWLAEYDRHVGEPPAGASLVNVQDTISNTHGPDVSVDWLSCRSIEPGNLTDLGVNIGDVIGEYNALSDEVESEIALCFHSLSVLLYYAEIDHACQFLHRVTRAVETHGITAHYHLDPVAFDDQVIAKIRTLCDDVLAIHPEDSDEDAAPVE